MGKGRDGRTVKSVWISCSIALILSLAAFVAISRGIGPARFHVAVLVLAIFVQLVAAWISPRIPSSRAMLVYLLLVALLARALVSLMPGSNEGDYYRYLWDGALTANGVNPYSVSPEQAMRGAVQSAEVSRLAEAGRSVLKGINHPHLRTIYPPLAQALFALAYWIKPYSSFSWTLVLLLADLAATFLILFLLASSRLPLPLAAVYLWHPLVIVETYHYHHLDGALAPFLLLFIWGLSRESTWRASFGLAAAVGLKLWPLVLFPFVLLWFGRDRRRLAVAGLILAVLLSALFLPYWFALGSEEDSGAIVYAKTWKANEFAYRALDSLGWRAARAWHYRFDGRVIARTVLLVILVGASLAVAWKTRERGAASLSAAVSGVVLLMLLLTPTLYPWYFVPTIALAPFVPRPYFLCWSLLLPLTALTRSVGHPLLLLGIIHAAGWLLLIAHFGRLWRARTDV